MTTEATPAGVTEWGFLPDPCLDEVMSHLPTPDLANAALVSRHWRASARRRQNVSLFVSRADMASLCRGSRTIADAFPPPAVTRLTLTGGTPFDGSELRALFGAKPREVFVRGRAIAAVSAIVMASAICLATGEVKSPEADAFVATIFRRWRRESANAFDFAPLRTIDVSRCHGIRDGDVVAICSTFGPRGLERLSFAFCESLTMTALRAALAADAPGLVAVDASGIEPYVGYAALAAPPPASECRVRVLVLNGLVFGMENVANLLMARCTHLRALYIEQCATISDRVFSVFASIPGLSELHVSGTVYRDSGSDMFSDLIKKGSIGDQFLVDFGTCVFVYIKKRNIQTMVLALRDQKRFRTELLSHVYPELESFSADFQLVCDMLQAQGWPPPPRHIQLIADGDGVEAPKKRRLR